LVKNLAEFGKTLLHAGKLRLPKGADLRDDWSNESVESFTSHLKFGQLSLKDEAAGKVRVFAMVDSVTQSALKPLHDFLFSILRLLPNDGTFDQQASVTRSQAKAALSGMAYSFDLSAATDRLPAKLSAAILENLIGIQGFGQAWLDLLVQRDYCLSLNAKACKRYGLEYQEEDRKFRYAVGQPMGGLSS